MGASPTELGSAEPDASISVAPVRLEGRALPRLAAFLAAVAVLEALSLVLFAALPYSPLPLGLDFITIGFLASVVLFPLVGALIIGRRPRTRVAWVMVFTGLSLGTALFTYSYGIVGMLLLRPPGALAMEMLVVSQLFFVPAIGLGTTILILLFPTDRLLGPRWRLAIVIGVVGLALYSIGTMFRADQLDAELLPGLVNPLSRAAPALAAAGPTLILAGNVLMVSMILPAAASMVLRYRRADPVVAAQIRWFAVFAGLAAICLSASAFDFGPLSDLAFQVGIVLLACVPIAIGIAITRYRLYEIDRLINRTLVYGSLTAILAGVFTAGVGLAQRLFVAFTGQSSDAAIVLATLVVATLYAPLRKWLEGRIDKRFKYEQRRFGSYTDRVRSVLVVIDPVRAAENLARETINELDAIGVAVVDASGSVVATAGLWPPAPGLPVTEIKLSDNSHLFAVRLGPRRSGVGYRAEELALLAEAGRLTAAAVRPG